MLKEGRKILLAPREMPMSAIMLENMTKLAKLGVVISPAVGGYYSNIQTIDDLENFIIGRWFDSLDIKHNLYKRWGDT
jgi:4-hydroxy-3-polyprenylbenzoate decarboxylase